MSIVKKAPYNSANIFLSGEIYTGMAKQLEQELSELGAVDKINVYIDTPGGNYQQGIDIFMTLSIHLAFVTTHTQGLAGSMGSIIAMAGQERLISANSWIMLHPVTGGGSAGNAQANKRMINIYADTTELSHADLSEMFESGDTWLDSGTAVAAGFSDFITPPVPFHNEASYLKHRLPQNYLASKYESFSGAKAKRKSQLLKNKMAYTSNKAAILRDQLELCDQHGITHQEFNLLMNQ